MLNKIKQVLKLTAKIKKDRRTAVFYSIQSLIMSDKNTFFLEINTEKRYFF